MLIWYGIIFRCTQSYADRGWHCSNSSEFWDVIGYCIVATVGSIFVSQELRKSSNKMKDVDPFISRTLIPSDHEKLGNEQANLELMGTIMAIVTGWAWNDVVAEKCDVTHWLQ